MTKDEVIAILRKAGGFVSGEEISQALGLSRAAVNFAVKSLRAEGYDILSSTKKGYYLRGTAEKPSMGELLALLPKERLESVTCLETIDSTNSCLRALAQGGAVAGQAVIANSQSAGRGRLGRSFFSPENEGLYFSYLFRPETSPADTSCITARVAVAMCDAIEAVCGVRPGIKWVNDLVLNGRKLCGILTEMSLESENAHIQYLITGIGVNVNQSADGFPEDIRAVASSLLAETGVRVSRARLACEMIKRLDLLRAQWPREKSKYLDAYRESCVTLGKEVRFTRAGSTFTAFAEDISEDFGLIVRYPDGTRETISSGEVSVRGLYGYV